MSEFDDTLEQHSDWCGDGYRCTGWRTNGKPCRAICRYVPPERFWPGFSDRCVHHVDGLDRRSREIARIAWDAGAAEPEKLTPCDRARMLEEIRRAEQARLAAVRLSGSAPMDRTSRFANGATGRQGGQGGQLTFGFARPLSQRLEEPPRLEPGPRPTISNAVDPPAVKTEGRPTTWPA